MNEDEKKEIFRKLWRDLLADDDLEEELDEEAKLLEEHVRDVKNMS